MKKIIFTLTLFLAVFTAMATDYPKDHCANHNTKKCFMSGSSSKCGIKKYWFKSIPQILCRDDEDSPEIDTEASPSTGTPSSVETLTYSYTHDVIEYKPAIQNVGCQSCSGGDTAPVSYKMLYLERYHRFRQMSDRGSFGPGIFSNYDNYFTFYLNGSTPQVDMFFGADMSMRRYFKQGNAFYDTFAGSSKSLEIYKADNTVTTSLTDAHHATLETFEGEKFYFDLFEIDTSTKMARMSGYEDRNGYEITVNYLYTADASVTDPMEKFKLTSVSDPNNRTIQFEYLAETRSGMWVVSKITLPNGSFIQYNYGSTSTDPLTSVDYPDGTTSTFSATLDTSGNTIVSIFEAGEEGRHRNKKLNLDSNFNGSAIGNDGVKYWNAGSLLINNITIGSGAEEEKSYAIYQNPSGGNNRRIYDGGNKLKSTNIISAPFYKQWEKDNLVDDDFNSFINLTTEESHANGDWKFYLANAQMRPPVMTDKHGVKHTYVYNSDNRKIKKTYEDGTFERWSYNSFNLPTRHRDRLGRVTHWDYDSRGNLISRTEGLVAQVTGSAGETISGLLCKVYDWTNNTLPTDYNALTPVETLSVPNLEISATDRQDTYALEFSGEIEITTAGDYTFFLSSDDGSKLYIDDVLIIDNDGLHSNTELSNEVPLTLTAGQHTIRVEFFEKYGLQQLFLKYQGPDSGEVKMTVPDSAYTHTSVAEELQETDVSTPEIATCYFSYYEAGHANEYLLKTETDANGNVTTYTYNADNLLEYVKTMNDAGVLNDINKSYFTYDSAKRLKTSTDAAGRTTSYDYDSRDRVTKITYSDLSTELFIFGSGSDANLLMKKKDRNGNTTKFEYNTKGQPSTITTAYSMMNEDGTSEVVNSSDIQSVETRTYLYGTDLVETSTVDGDLTEFIYDYRNRLIETKRHADDTSILTEKTFYKNNLVQWREDPYGRRTYYSYRIKGADKSDTAMNRMVQESVPGAVYLPNGYYSDIDALTRNLSNNAPYVITDYELDVEGQRTATIDPRNIRYETDYDSRGRTMFSVQAVGTTVEATTQYIYDANSNVTEIRSPRYFTENIAPETRTYGARNMLATRTVADGSLYEATESYTYYDDGRAKDHTDFRGNTSTQVWKQCCGRLGVVAGPVYTDKDGNQKRSAQIIEYDYFGNATHTAVLDWNSTTTLPPCCFPDPDDNLTVQEATTKYDARHRPVAQSSWLDRKDGVVLDKPGSIDPNLVPIETIPTTTSYGLTTRVTYYDEATGHADLQPLLDKLTAAGITFGTNTDGSAQITESPEGEISVAIQDGAGRTVASGMYDKDDYVLGTFTLVTWNITTYDNVVNNLLETKSTSALGFENIVRTDGLGRKIQSIDALGKVSTLEYDANSNLLSFRDPNGVGQDCLYDERNRDTSCTDTDGDTTSRTYDANSNIVTKTDGKSVSESCVFDDRNRLESCTDRINATTAYTYDNNNNVLTITDSLAKVTTYGYDSRNLQVQVTYPDHIAGQNPGDANYGIITCSYDALGRKAVCTDQKGETVSYDFDWGSRLLSRDYGYINGTVESTDTFTYDKASRVLTASKGRYSNTVTYSYDEIGRIYTEALTVEGNTYTTTHSYDADNRVTNCAYPAGNNVGKDWTNRNQLENVTFNAADVITSTFDDGMREYTRTFGNSLTTTFSYYQDNTRSGISVAGKADLSFTYTYDANKNVEGETTTGIVMDEYSWTAGFDGIDRITSWSRSNSDNQSWSLDSIGNWQSTTGSLDSLAISETRTHNDAHELTSINSNSLAFDSKGNMTSNEHGHQLTWDIDNHLVSVYKGSGNGGGVGKGMGNGLPTGLSKYEYDALGRRVLKHVGNVKTVFVSSGQRIIEEYESTAGQAFQLARSYVYGSYVDDVLAKIEAVSTPTILYYHSDRQFNVRGVTDVGGNIIELYSYTPYGKQTIMDASGTELMNSAVSNVYGYTGRYLDEETGLWYFRARYFDNELGRFISRDPLGYVDGMSLYNGYFAEGFNLDPSGLSCVDDGLRQALGEVLKYVALKIGGKAAVKWGTRAAALAVADGPFPIGDGIAILTGVVAAGFTAWDITDARKWVKQIWESVMSSLLDVDKYTDCLEKKAECCNEFKEKMKIVGKRIGQAFFLKRMRKGLVGRLRNDVANAVDNIITCCLGCAQVVRLSRSRYPQATKHLEDTGGTHTLLTIDRDNAGRRRNQALRDHPTRPGLDRDESIPAMFQEGGAGSSVRYIDPSDNRGAGASIGAQLRRTGDGQRIVIRLVD